MDRKPDFYDKIVFGTKVTIMASLWSFIAGGAIDLSLGHKSWQSIHWFMWSFTGPAAGFLIAYGLKKR